MILDSLLKLVKRKKKTQVEGFFLTIHPSSTLPSPLIGYMSISFSLASLPYFTNSLSSTVLTLIENNFHIYCGPHLGGCLLFLHPVCLCSCNTMQQKPSNRVLLKFSGLIGDKVTLKKLKVLNIDPDM